MLNALLSAFTPHPCCGCGDLYAILCESCKYDITNESYSRCIECGVFEPTGICKMHARSYQLAWCIGERRQALEQLLNQLKFQRLKSASVVAAQLLTMALPELPTTTIITSIPTAPSHIRERGYDHALLIGRTFAAARSLRFSNLLKRNHELSQKDASRVERRKQAATAFEAKEILDPSVPYLLIDDIVTTGASLRYAAEALRRAGAQTIWVAVIARQPLD